MMADLFSTDWMIKFKDAWNNEPELADALSAIGFNSVIGYGFPEDEKPKGYIAVQNGKVTNAGSYSGESLNWDIRAKSEDWQKWIKSEIGLVGLGAAFTTGKLKFKQGDYGAMIKDPKMTSPFVKSFSVMGRV
jgi:hypothetical protein